MQTTPKGLMTGSQGMPEGSLGPKISVILGPFCEKSLYLSEKPL
jgi:hypothetical protein